jgi:hypothetical protein
MNKIYNQLISLYYQMIFISSIIIVNFDLFLFYHNYINLKYFKNFKAKTKPASNKDNITPREKTLILPLITQKHNNSY